MVMPHCMNTWRTKLESGIDDFSIPELIHCDHIDFADAFGEGSGEGFLIVDEIVNLYPMQQFSKEIDIFKAYDVSISDLWLSGCQ